MSEKRMDEISKMVIEGLHRDNHEIFGQDYGNKD
jgi:hypothetical protein